MTKHLAIFAVLLAVLLLAGAAARADVVLPTGTVRQLTSGSVWSWQGTWSPNGQWVAYHKGDGDAADNTYNGCIYKVKADGTAVTKLTDGYYCDSKPRWSPDGRWLAFQRYDKPYDYNSGGHYASVWKMKADGTAQSKVAGYVELDLNDDGLNDGGGALDPVWSPDGYWIAFKRGGGSNNSFFGNESNGLYVVRPNGTGLRSLTNPAGSTGATFGFSPGIFDVQWKPAGIGTGVKILTSLQMPLWWFNMSYYRQIALVSRTRPGSNRWLTNGWGYSCQNQPSWSQNGRKIAYKDDTIADGDLWTMNANGSGKVRLTNTAIENHDDPGNHWCYAMPAWHSSGRYIAAFHTRNNQGDYWASERYIVILRADGTKMITVTPDFWADDANFGYRTNSDIDLAFNRQGTKILFVARDTSDRGQLWVVDLDTGDDDGDGIRNWEEGLR